jgi:hypothetical protein
MRVLFKLVEAALSNILPEQCKERNVAVKDPREKFHQELSKRQDKICQDLALRDGSLNRVRGRWERNKNLPVSHLSRLCMQHTEVIFLYYSSIERDALSSHVWVDRDADSAASGVDQKTSRGKPII